MDREPVITLKIAEAGTPAFRSLMFDLYLDGVRVGGKELTRVEFHQVEDVSGQPSRILLDEMYLEVLGDTLFRMWFERDWKSLKSVIPGCTLVVESDLALALALPWEAIRAPGGELFCHDPENRVYRRPLSTQPPSRHKAPSGPLRALHFAPGAAHSRDEEAFLRSVEGSGLSFELGRTGTLEELGQKVENFRPHLVHISGEVVLDGGRALLVFEDDAGAKDTRTASDVAAAVARASAVVLGVPTSVSQRALAGFCLDLLNAGVYAAVLWPLSGPSSPYSSQYKSPYSDLYKALGRGMALDAALSQARRDLFPGASWALPVLYAHFPAVCEPEAVPGEALSRAGVQQPFPGSGKGRANPFVGRREELQRTLSGLRNGSLKATVITGPPGSGKGAFAARLAELSEMPLLSVVGSTKNPVTLPRVVEAWAAAVRKGDHAEDTGPVLDPTCPTGDRVRSLVESLNRGGYLLVLDEIELAGSKIRDPEMAALYSGLRGLSNSRALVAARSLPLDLPRLPRRWTEVALRPLAEVDSVRFLLEREVIRSLFSSGELSYDDLGSLAGAVPRPYLEQARAAVSSSEDLEKVIREAGKGGLPATFLRPLGHESLKGLARAAVLRVPVGLEVMERVAGTCLEDAAPAWENLALAFSTSGLWAVMPHLRPLLLGATGPDQRREAEKVAGDVLMEMAGRGGPGRLDHLLEARAHYLRSGDLEGARDSTAQLSALLTSWGFHDHVEKLNLEVLEREDHPVPMSWIGHSFYSQGKLDRSKKWYARALLASGRVGKAAAVALHGMGSADLASGRDTEARESFAEALDIEREIGDLRSQAATLEQLARIDLGRGGQDSAKGYLVEALGIHRRLGETRGEAAALYYLATLDLAEEDFETAGERLASALELYKEVGNLQGTASCLYNLATVDLKGGDRPAAVEKLGEALEIQRQIGDEAGEAAAFFQLGSAAVLGGRVEEGLRLVALSGLILKNAGHPDFKRVEPSVAGLASQLGYDQAAFDSMIKEVAAAYGRDKGRGLVKAAFSS